MDETNEFYVCDECGAFFTADVDGVYDESGCAMCDDCIESAEAEAWGEYYAEFDRQYDEIRGWAETAAREEAFETGFDVPF